MLNFRIKSSVAVKTLSGLWRINASKLTSNYYFISCKEDIYHACFDCLKNFLQVSLFTEKSFAHKVLDRNCAKKHLFDKNCLKLLSQILRFDLGEDFPCFCKFTLITKIIVDDFHDLDKSYKINKE